VSLDQVAKAIVVEWLGPGQVPHRWEFAGRLVAFEYVENRGAAFGILAGQTWLLSVLALVVAAGFIAFCWNELPTSALLRISIGLVLGGGFGNLLDRLRLGYVVDFIAVGNWPKFNLADSAITIGLILLAFGALRDNSTSEDIL
jgi:signal peptidase II